MDGCIPLHHLLPLVIFLASQVDHILLVDPKPADVIDLEEEAVVTGFLDPKPAREVSGDVVSSSLIG